MSSSLKRDVHRLAGLHRRRRLVAVAVREVEDAVGDARRAAVGMDVAEPHRDHGGRTVGEELEPDHRSADDVERRLERRCRNRRTWRRPRAGRRAFPARARWRSIRRRPCRNPAAVDDLAVDQLWRRGKQLAAGSQAEAAGRDGCGTARPARRSSGRAAPRTSRAAARSPSGRAAWPGRSRRRCRCPSASGPTSAAPPAGSRWRASARRNAGTCGSRARRCP